MFLFQLDIKICRYYVEKVNYVLMTENLRVYTIPDFLVSYSLGYICISLLILDSSLCLSVLQIIFPINWLHFRNVHI